MRSLKVIKKRLLTIEELLSKEQHSFTVIGYHNYVTFKEALECEKKTLKWVLSGRTK